MKMKSQLEIDRKEVLRKENIFLTFFKIWNSQQIALKVHI